MQIVRVENVLSDAGLTEPSLSALQPDRENYEVLLLQPVGLIDATTAGVKNRENSPAADMYPSFLAEAARSEADLVVTPEYSMPWDVVREVVASGKGPAPRKIWALGCESIKIHELEALRDELEPHATLLFDLAIPSSDRFVSPLAYLFKTRDSDDQERTVILVQFKTEPLGDQYNFEINEMQRGTCIYLFGAQPIRLVTLICADVFELTDDLAGQLYERSLILNIQLNPHPRHQLFRDSRAKLFRYSGDETELICLNWARGVRIGKEGQDAKWEEASGSAWYLKSRDFDEGDATVNANHQKGLYYTWHSELRAHTLFFCDVPSLFRLRATKVAHVGVQGALSNRCGPTVTEVLQWSAEHGQWEDPGPVDSRFEALSSECGNAQDAVLRVVQNSPIGAERVLAICSGECTDGQDWHKVSKLDSCVIDATEIVFRVTYAQDPHQRARDFRNSRVKRFERIWMILDDENQRPPALLDLKDGFEFDWSSASPHQNIRSAKGRGTAIYMGEDATDKQIEMVAMTVSEYLRRESADGDAADEAMQRFFIWYRNGKGNVVLHSPDHNTAYDRPSAKSPFDIARNE